MEHDDNVSFHHIHNAQKRLPDNTNCVQFCEWLKGQPQLMNYVLGSMSP
jgi:hypothetical protein